MSQVATKGMQERWAAHLQTACYTLYWCVLHAAWRVMVECWSLEATRGWRTASECGGLIEHAVQHSLRTHGMPPILYSLDCHEVPKAPLGTALGLAHSLAVPPADTARSERHGRVAQDEQPWRVACAAAMHHTTRCGVGRAQSHGSHRTRPHLDHDERAQELQHAIARRSVRGRRGAAQHDQPCPVEYGEPLERAGERRRNRYWRGCSVRPACNKRAATCNLQHTTMHATPARAGEPVPNEHSVDNFIASVVN
jgi:hypothetical protein